MDLAMMFTDVLRALGRVVQLWLVLTLLVGILYVASRWLAP
jgi:hypothetical protein